MEKSKENVIGGIGRPYFLRGFIKNDGVTTQHNSELKNFSQGESPLTEQKQQNASEESLESLSYDICETPSRFLEEGEFFIDGRKFIYRFKCPVCGEEAFFGQHWEKNNVLRAISAHGWEHVVYFRRRWWRR